MPGTKPKQIKHTQSALVIDDIITPRVTSLGYSGDLNSEEIEELGNVNIVEILDDTPTISSTIDVNDYGSIETLAVLCNKHDRPQYNIINGNAWDSTYWEIDATDFEEAAVDFINPVKSTSGNYHTSWFNNCQIQSYSSTYSVDGFATESISLENSSQYVLINDYKYARVLVPACRNYSDNAGAQFDGTTAYTVTINADDFAGPIWVGQNDVAGDSTAYHFNDLGDIFASAVGDSTGAFLTKNGVIQNRSYWDWDGTCVAVTPAGDGELYWSLTDRLRLVALGAGVQTFAGPTATGRAGLRKGNTKIYFWDAADDTPASSFGLVGDDSTTDFAIRQPAVGSSTYAKRVQSVSLDITWNRDQLEQLGEHEPYDRGVESTEITATISAIGSDAELFAIAAGKTRYGDSTGEWGLDQIASMNLTDFQSATNLAIRIDIFNTTDVTKHTAANRMKSILLTGGKVTSFGDTIDVPGRATTDLSITFNGAIFMGDKVIANRTAV